MGLQLLCACFLLWPSITHCCLCNCSMGRLFWVSPGYVGSSVVSQAGSQATWILVTAQPAPEPLSDSLPIPMCQFLCLETGDLFCSDLQPFELSHAQKQLSDVVSCQNTADYFLLPGQRIVKIKASKQAAEKILQVYQATYLHLSFSTKFSSSLRPVFVYSS